MKRVWFNKSFSQSYYLMQSLKGRGFFVLGSHTDEYSPMVQAGQVGRVEPRNVVGEDYVSWCLDFCRREGVDVFFPGKEKIRLTDATDRFQSLGVRLVVAGSGGTMRLLNDKVRLFQALEGQKVQIPTYFQVSSALEFESAVREIEGRDEVACFKPVEGVFGNGFYILRRESWKSMEAGNRLVIGMDRALAILRAEETFPKLMVMRYLEGNEWSVDCLAHRGDLIRWVGRRKAGAYQVLENPEGLEEAVRNLTAHFELSGIFNIQFRESQKERYLLEINPRPSGGIGVAMVSGVDFGYWAVRLAMEDDLDRSAIPQPRWGCRVAQMTEPLELRGCGTDHDVGEKEG